MTTDTRRATADLRTAGQAWQDSIQAMVSGYGDYLRRMSQIPAGFYGGRWFDQEETRKTLQRIADGTRELTAAQVGVASEWLRAPFWFTGAASPRDLQARYFRLFEAQRDLVQIYLDAFLGFQRALTGATEQAVETTREAVDVQVQTARRVANDAATATEATADAARRTATAGRQAAERVVEQAREAAEQAEEQAELALRPIKGNVNSRGEKIYHLPGQASYDRVDAEQTFNTEREAQRAGFRRAER